MKQSTTHTIQITVEYDDEVSTAYEAQEAVLQNFPDSIAGVKIAFVEIVGHLLDSDDVVVR